MSEYAKALEVQKYNRFSPRQKCESKMQKWKIFASRVTTRSFKLQFMVCDLKGLPQDGVLNSPNNYLIVQLEWRGARSQTRYLPQVGTERNCTSKQCIQSDGVVNWNESFDHDCNLKLKDSQHFKSWVVNLEIHRLHQESNSEALTLAKVKVDIAEFASLAKSSKKTISIPVKYVLEGSTADAMLVVQLAFSEVQTKSNSTVHPLSQTLLLPSLSSCIRLPQQSHSTRSQNPKVVREKNDIAGRRTSLKQTIDPSASDSESGEEPEFSYRSLSAKNLQQVDLTCSKIESGKNNENQDELRSENHLPKQQPSLVRLLSWNKRKLSFRSLIHPRDTPLLNKANCENGGDDIDNDRRYQFISPQPIQAQGEDYLQTSGFLSSDRFEVGAWEERKLVSRDGSLELETEIFLASIDQRSEKAAGGSACTVLVAVIADWLHQNPKDLPLRCQLDKLVREGSSEWRNLCENETLKEKFPDQHFDLDTVLQAKVRPLSVISEQSYIGFFALENMSDQFEFLQEAMSFDNIWEKLQSNDTTSAEHIYIVSWNDHFFLLKVEVDAIYIIDTLGERLFEGCNTAYILKFNKDSKLHRVKPRPNSEKQKAKNADTGSTSTEAEMHDKNSREIVSEGKDSCKEFIKGFLAALPLRELQADIARGKMGEAPLHHRLQIEFHYTAPCKENSRSNMQTEEQMPSQVPNYYTNNIPDPKDIS